MSCLRQVLLTSSPHDAIWSRLLGHLALCLVSYNYKARKMEHVLERTSPADTQAVGLKAFSRIADAWSLTGKEASALADMSESTWKRARKPGYLGDLSHDQLLRLSALIGIYKSLELYFDAPIAQDWVKLENAGPEFDRRKPIDAMIAGGLPKILRVRTYLDALRGGV